MPANLHANLDSFALARARPGAGAAAYPDRTQDAVRETAKDAAKDDLEIRRCASYLRSLIAVGFVMTFLSSSLAFGWWRGVGDYGTEAGFVGVMLFGLTTCWLIWMLPTERGAVVVLTRYGIRDLRLDNEFLPWESIAEVSPGRCRRREVVVLKLTPALQRQRCCIKSGQDMRLVTPPPGADHIVVSPKGLAISFDTLLQTCRDFHAASEQRSALQQGHRDADGVAE